MAFYGVYVPPKFEPSVVAAAAAAATNNDADKNPMVFAKREEAFKVLKTHSDARVKGFASREEACRFAQFGQDLNVTSNHSFNDSSKQLAQQQQQQPLLKSPSSLPNPEKTAFRGPKIQELVEFRKAIESGNLTVVNAKITENPRFLVGSGDTPTILKEGQRYNAMHVAALSKNPKMCELILTTIKPSFVQRLHGGRQTAEVSEEVAEKLLDLYLNTPEKGRFETPLHLAVKYGAADVVEVLTSYPQCKMLPNKEEHWPKDIICFRAPGLGDDVKERIAKLLEERFYVPVLRSTDSTVPPVIGEPFSARCLPQLNTSSGAGRNSLTPDMQIRAYAGPMDHEQAENFRKRWRTPPATGCFNRSADRSNILLNGSSTNNSFLSVSGMGAGEGGADNVILMRSPIRRPPVDSRRNIQRLLVNNCSPVMANLVSTPKGKNIAGVNGERNSTAGGLRSIDEFFGSDSEGVEAARGSQEALNRLDVTPKKAGNQSLGIFNNSTPIKSPMVLLSSPGGGLLRDADDEDLDASYRERHLKITDTDKGLEVIGRLLAKERNVGWNEYWTFLDDFTNLTTKEGLQQLEQHFKRRAEEAERQSKRNSLSGGGVADKEPPQEKLNISDICDRLNELHLNNSLKLHQNGDAHNNHNNDNQQQLTPLNAFLCVEKSCQVYAKRATKKMTASGVTANASQLNATLNSELGRLESLVCSYKDDLRFKRIDFQVVHSRFAHLVLTYLLEDEVQYKELLPKLKRSLSAIKAAEVREVGDPTAPDEAENALRDMRISRKDHHLLEKDDTVVKSTTSHSRCLARFLQRYAENEEEKIKQQDGLGKLVAEDECQRVWERETKCDCAWVGKGSLTGSNSAGQNAKNGQVQRLRDKNKKKRINDRIKRKIEMANADGNQNNNGHPAFGAMWMEYRNKMPSTENEDDVIWADSNDSDHSLDSTDSEECFFYTPVESPTEFLTASEHSGSEEDEDDLVVRRPKAKRQSPGMDLKSYKNYVLGDEPTKTDMDVFNAICDVEVDEKVHPHIAKWQKAIRMHSMEEIQNFPSLSMIVRKSLPVARAPFDTGSPLQSRRLFPGMASPLRLHPTSM